jgi:hypothetical protein
MKSRFTLIRSALLVLLVSISLACSGGGGDGGGSSPVDSTPSISNLQFFPNTALQNDGNGTLTVIGTFDFTDQGKDIATLYIVSFDGSTLSAPIEGVSGEASGTIQGTLEVDTTTVGQFSFELYVTDSAGNKSNTLTGTFVVTVNDTGSHWSVQTLPTSSSLWLKRVRWSGSLFVTVSEGGSIFTSPDAVTWTERASVVSSMLNDVTWTGNQFVVVGDNGKILTSADAQTWFEQVIPPAIINPVLNGIASSSSLIVAVGTQWDSGASTDVGLIMTSSDGVIWTSVPGTIPAALYAVIWSGNQFVAVGSTLGQPNAEAIAFTSPDGITWTSRPMSFTGLASLYDIAWNGSRFVAVGYAGAVTSTDGSTWQQTGLGVVGPNQAIAWSGQRFITCGTVYCQLSTDGLQWQSAQLPGVGPSVYGITWNGTKWVVVGSSSYVATSP